MDVIRDVYIEIQALRQKLLGAVLAFLSTLKVLQLSAPKDGNVALLFRNVVPNFHGFSPKCINKYLELLYCGQIQYELNSFVHSVCDALEGIHLAHIEETLIK